MFLLDFFSGNKRKPVKKGKKKKKNEHYKIELSHLNPLKEVKMFGYFKMGSGPKKTECQDSLCMMDRFSDDCFFFAVYDGHGASGKEASHAANDHIQNYFEKNIKKIKQLNSDMKKEEFFAQAFYTAEEKLKASGIDYSNSGTCCISVFIQRNKAFVANIGDSRCVLGRVTTKEKSAIELSNDHKPTRPDERNRILKSGGKIERFAHDGVPVGPYRVWADEEGPGIAMTRSVGDLLSKKIGLICEPEIECIELTPNDKFLVIGSDGLWDVMGSTEVVGFVLQHEHKESVAEALVLEARSRWEEMGKTNKRSGDAGIGDVPFMKFGCDDITAVVAYLTFFTEDELEEIAKHIMPVQIEEKEKDDKKTKGKKKKY